MAYAANISRSLQLIYLGFGLRVLADRRGLTRSKRKPSAAHDGSLLRRGFLLLTVAAC